jgi:hypothetical protein
MPINKLKKQESGLQSLKDLSVAAEFRLALRSAYHQSHRFLLQAGNLPAVRSNRRGVSVKFSIAIDKSCATIAPHIQSKPPQLRLTNTFASAQQVVRYNLTPICSSTKKTASESRNGSS